MKVPKGRLTTTREEHLRRLRTDWDTLGQVDPLWAVYVREDTRDGGWDPVEFLATGEEEIADSWRRLAELGLAPAPTATVLDFGCGAGRLTCALARRSEKVVGIDISASMLATAGRMMDPDSRARVRLVLSDSRDLPLRSSCVDVVYTSLVLQHMPKRLALGYIAEFLRVLRPGGVAVIQVAERQTLSAKGLAFRVLPASAYGWIQRRALGYPAPMRMGRLSLREVSRAARTAHGDVVSTWTDASYGGHWSYRRIVIRALEGPAP